EFRASAPSSPLRSREALVTACAVLFIVQGDAELVLGRLSATRADLELVGAIAHLQLAARRIGCAIRLEGVSKDLCDLLELAGLTACGLRVEPRRETEGSEELGVQEVVDAGDASAGDL